MSADLRQPGQGGERADSTLGALADHIGRLTYDLLDAAAVEAAKVRVLDTLGALYGGYHEEVARLSRGLAEALPVLNGASIVGSGARTTVDLAAFVNATTARCAELNDEYHRQGSRHGHPSDVVMPLLAVAEQSHASGRRLVAAVAVGYEIYLELSDATLLEGFDASTFAAVAVAGGAAKLLSLSPEQTRHALAMAVVPHNALNEARSGHLSMWKAAAAGEAGRAGVFAAHLAAAGLTGPSRPFEGENGWLSQVVRGPLPMSLGPDRPFRVNDSYLKTRAACFPAIPSILAAEQVGLSRQELGQVARIRVEVYQYAKDLPGTGRHRWHPRTRESADHSIPYTVVAALCDGTVSARQFDAAHLSDPVIRQLMAKVEVHANDEFTRLYEGTTPPVHRARVLVELTSGRRLVGETGGVDGDVSDPIPAETIVEKFIDVAGGCLDTARARSIADRCLSLDEVVDTASLVPSFVL